MSKDYYKILGVGKNATEEEIKKAFHKLAHQHHPDKGGEEEKFKEINEAYQILSNREKRAQYDQYGQVFEGNGFPGGQPGAGFGGDFNWAWGNQQGGSSEQGFNFDFEDLGDIFGDVFGFGGGNQAAKKDLKKGRDIQVEIEISLEETLADITKIITLEKLIKCDRCKGSGGEPGTKVKECFSCRGTGQVQQVRRTMFGSFTRVTVCPECGGEGYKPEKPCIVCKGEGRIRGKEDIDIFIPAGVDSNQIIKVAGKGDAGRKGGKAGDLFVRIEIEKHPVFSRKGDDLYTSIPISFSQAGLGDEVEFSLLEGAKILLKVPEGSESGKIIKISGKGIPHFSGYGRGNLYIELIVKTPKKLSRKQRESLEKLREEGL